MALTKNEIILQVSTLLASLKPGGILAEEHRTTMFSLIDRAYDEAIDDVEIDGLTLAFSRNNGDGPPIVVELSSAVDNVEIQGLTLIFTFNDPDRPALEVELPEPIQEAPTNGMVFVRRNATWVEGKTKVSIDQQFSNVNNELLTKANKEIVLLTNDAGILEIQDPTLADNVNFNFRRNVPNGVLKLNSLGLVPLNLLPSTNLVFIGPWDATSGSLPQDAVQFNYRVITFGGTLNLIVQDGQPPVPTIVSPNDEIVFISTGIWAYKPASQSVVLAQNVLFNNVASGLQAEQVQEAIEEVYAAQDEKADRLIQYSSASASRAINAGDIDKMVMMNSSAATVLTIPNNTDLPLPVGANFAICQLGSGLVSIAGAAGVTFPNGELTTSGPGTVLFCTKFTTNFWIIVGGVA